MVGDILPCCPYPDCRNKISAIVRRATIRKCRNSKQTNKTLAIVLRWKSSEFCHSIGWRGWWSFYRGEGWESWYDLAEKSTAESTMGFLCMSPNGPLYGQNVWAMRIYAGSSYSPPRCFTPTNSPTAFILLSALKKTLDEWILLLLECIHSHRRGWDTQAESVIPWDSTDCTVGEIKREIEYWHCSR